MNPYEEYKSALVWSLNIVTS